MTRTPEFYDKYVIALFHRGKAETLPLEYLEKEAAKVLRNEMDEFRTCLDRLVSVGTLTRDKDTFSLVGQA